jgi:putative ABC transport system ATP-binding protein
MSVISMAGVSKVYGFGDASTIALDDVSLEVDKGEFLAVMGPSGSGKSTLLNLIGLLDTPSQGSYMLDGKPVAGRGNSARAKIRREQIGFIFQSFNLLNKMTVIDNVALPLMYSGVGHVERLERASTILKNLGMGEREYYFPNQLSGGQTQRAAIARALANNPSIILADEPTGNLDSKTGKKIMDTLKDLNEQGNTIVMVTHDPVIAKYASRTVHVVDGKIEETGVQAKPKNKKGEK